MIDTDIEIIRPVISEEEREKRIKNVEEVLSNILKVEVELVKESKAKV